MGSDIKEVTVTADAAPTPVATTGKGESFGVLVSKLDYPVILAYDGRQLKLSARGQTGLLNRRALSEPLPAGVIFVTRAV